MDKQRNVVFFVFRLLGIPVQMISKYLANERYNKDAFRNS